ncbi:MAG: S8 family serine peptidase [Candidatus Cloacimonetes bacterium]|nr:S8 family serine peptidase [Candidatus Cloacimonadota bacterium]MDD2506763.1 S8 family serine peptidase [Candidatus Cloacimonadota bacterium]MDD4147248.1 S8 family serine peptidase [Candidatus Cloacimonadota bacterium]MDD4560261.1 S8 family serine peptidase [Candidatus Cloacimonadota bacterium]
MCKLRLLALLALVSVVAGVMNPGFAMPNYSPGQILFKTTQNIYINGAKTGLGAFDSFLTQHGVKHIKALKGMASNHYYSATVSIMPDLEQMKSLSFPGISFVEPNYLRKLHAIPNDPLYPRQLHNLVNLPAAWDYSTGNQQIVVGVVDSGMLINHPDLTANVYRNLAEIPDNGIDDDGNGYIDDWCGWDFADAPEMIDVAMGDYLDQDNDVEDENHHGTHVSGIIGAMGNNGLGVCGVCWNLRLMPLRAGFRTADAGFLQDDDAAAAIIYAADNGCHVINMSWGDPNYSAIIADACEYAYNKGVTLIASSGNESGPIITYPAKLSTVVSVGSVNAAKVLSNFSSYGPGLDMVAPGEAIISTYNDSGTDMYMEMSGTSMSSPFVTGAVALLLSLVPGLSPAEIRARLLSSTDDIDAPGLDIRTGHGLLNVRKLLDNLNPPFVYVEHPLDQISIPGSTDIYGSVYGEDFACYTIMYRSTTNPYQSVWMDAKEHTQMPVEYTQQVHNGRLGEFYVPQSLPEDTYMLRIQYEKRYNTLMRYNYYFTVRVDRSAPQMKPGTLQSFARYENENLRYYISAVYDEHVHSRLMITDSAGQAHTVYGTVMDTLQIWPLPQSLPEGYIDFSVLATNRSEISSQSPMYNNAIDIRYHSIPAHGFIKSEIGKAKVPLNRWHDFDGNGKMEYIAMDLPVAGYGRICAYEPGPAGHVTKYDFGQNGWPLDLGNSFSDGMELLLLQSETAKLWESFPQADLPYPQPDSLTFSDTSIVGGAMGNFNTDSVTDLLLVKNKPDRRVIQLYSRNVSGMMLARNELLNNTPTTMRNNFVPTVITDSLNFNARPDILCADTDGDIMIYEVQNNALAPMIWHHRFPVGNTYHLATGDFNGDGQRDFVVGGSNTNSSNPHLNFWRFEAYTYSEADTTFVSMGNIMFNNVESQNAIVVADMNSDGKDELILALSPNLYIVEHDNEAFKPIFMGDSSMNYRLAAYTGSDGRVRILANGLSPVDSLIALEWALNTNDPGLPAPINVVSQAMGPDSVRISWIDVGADAYSVYRRTEDEYPILLSTVNAEFLLDTYVLSGSTYSYAVSADFSNGSSLSAWHEATPLPIPEILEASMIGKRELRLLFNQAMPSHILNPNFYTLSQNQAHPISVNSTAQQHGVQLRFRDQIPQSDSPISIQIQGITGSSGIPMNQSSCTFTYVSDIEAPRVQSVSILNKNRSVEIVFDEDLEPVTASYTANYILNCPDNDSGNSIIEVESDGNKVIATFASALKYSNEAYFIEVINVQDLFGNPISPLHNLARFALREITDLSHIVVFPNPLKRFEHPEIAFMNFPPGKKGKIAIYDAAGSLVHKSSIGPFNPENNRIIWRWNATNAKGQKISSGVYFYVVEMDDERARGKFAVIN